MTCWLLTFYGNQPIYKTRRGRFCKRNIGTRRTFVTRERTMKAASPCVHCACLLWKFYLAEIVSGKHFVQFFKDRIWSSAVLDVLAKDSILADRKMLNTKRYHSQKARRHCCPSCPIGNWHVLLRHERSRRWIKGFIKKRHYALVQNLFLIFCTVIEI